MLAFTCFYNLSCLWFGWLAAWQCTVGTISFSCRSARHLWSSRLFWSSHFPPLDLYLRCCVGSSPESEAASCFKHRHPLRTAGHLMQRKAGGNGGNLCLRFCAICAAGDAQLQAHPIPRMSIIAHQCRTVRSGVVHEVDCGYYGYLWLSMADRPRS